MINVRYRHPDGRSGKLIATIARNALIRFSSYAARHLLPNTQTRNFGIITDAPTAAVIHILDWMKSQATALPPAPLPCPETFEEAVWVHQVGKAMGLFFEMRGEGVRDAIREYIAAAPLTAAEFAMVFEVLEFDWGLQKVVLREVRWRYRERGRKRGVPEYAEIMEFCGRAGIKVWEGMEEPVWLEEGGEGVAGDWEISEGRAGIYAVENVDWEE